MPEPFLPIFGKENTWIGRWSKQERWREDEIKSLLASVFTCFIQHYFFPLLVYSSFKTETLQDRDHSFSFSFPQIQPGLKKKKKKGNPRQYSCLENSMDRRAWAGYSHGVTKRRTRLSGWAQHRSSLGLAYCMGNTEGDWNERNRATALGVSRMQHTERWEVRPRRKRNRRYKGRKDLREWRERLAGADGGGDRWGQDLLWGPPSSLSSRKALG